MRITFTLKLYKNKEKTQLCKDVSIALLENPNFLYPCKHLGDGKFVVELPEGFVGGECLYFYAICNDCDTGTCPPAKVKVCPCEDDSDCPCGICVDGRCVFECPEELCVNDQCVECTPEAPCKCNQICVSGKCNCPPGTFLNSKGCCVECDNTTPLPNCFECLGGIIVPKDCPCDPVTGDCVECLNSGHCASNTDGRNCCYDNKCDCCPGFVYDNILKRCVEIPQCTTDSDCLECQICVSGDCVTLENYIIVNGQCVYAPCGDVDCETGLDCVSKDCGCDQVSQKCVDCKTNPTALGCNTKCNGAPCSSPDDCPEGCGCLGGQCVDCSNFPCGQKCENVPGCHCPNGVSCEDDGAGCTENDFTSKITNCSLVTTLRPREVCSCPVISAGSFIEKLAFDTLANKYKASLDFKVQLRKGLAQTIGEFNSLPKLDDVTHPDIAENEEPSNGTFRLDVIITTIDESAPGVFIQSSKQSTTKTFTQSIKDKTEVLFSNIDLGNHSTVIGTHPVRSLYRTVYSVQFKVFYNNLEFYNNCDYGTDEILNKTYLTNGFNPTLTPIYLSNGNIQIDRLSSLSNRFALFKYQKSKDSTFTDAEYFRKVYVPLISNKYVDTLYGPACIDPDGKYPLVTPEGELWSGYNYRITNDCACREARENIIEPLVICEKPEIDWTMENCNKKLTIQPYNIVCPINKDLDEYRTTACMIPEDAQVYYIHTITLDNGNVVTYNTKGSQPLTVYNTASLTGTNKNKSIARITIVHSQDPTCILLDESFSKGTDAPIYEVYCENDGVQVVIPQEQGSIDLLAVTYNGTPLPLNNLGNFTYKIPTLDFETIDSATFKYLYAGGCELDVEIPLVCCTTDSTLKTAPDIILTTDGTTPCNGNITEVTVSYTGFGGEPEISVLYPLAGGSEIRIPSTQTPIFTPLTFDAAAPGTYIVTATFKDCVVTKEVTLSCQNVELNLVPETICNNSTSEFRVTGGANTPFTYTVPGNLTPISATTNANGVFTTSVNTPGTYSIVSVSGVALVTPITEPLTSVAAPVITSIQLPTSACENTPIALTVQGTPGSEISYTIENGAAPISATLVNGTYTSTISYSTPGVKTFQVTLVSLNGNCVTANPANKTITINETPEFSNIVMTCNTILTEYQISGVVTPSTSVVSSTVGTVSQTGGNFLITGIPSSATAIVEASYNGCIGSVSLTKDCDCDPMALGSNAANVGMCEGQTVPPTPISISEIQNYVFTGAVNYSLIQHLANGTSAPIIDYVIVTPGEVNINELPLPVSNGTYIEATFTDTVTNCSASLPIIPVFVDSPPLFTINAPATVCAGVGTIIGSTTGVPAGSTYLWSATLNGNVYSIANPNAATVSISPTSGEIGTFELSVTITNTGGCSSTESVSIASSVCCSTPVVATLFSNNCVGGNAYVTNYPSTQLFDYVWTQGGTTLFVDNGVNRSYIPLSLLVSGTITVEATVVGTNCTGTTTIPFLASTTCCGMTLSRVSPTNDSVIQSSSFLVETFSAAFTAAPEEVFTIQNIIAKYTGTIVPDETFTLNVASTSLPTLGNSITLTVNGKNVQITNTPYTPAPSSPYSQRYLIEVSDYNKTLPLCVNGTQTSEITELNIEFTRPDNSTHCETFSGSGRLCIPGGNCGYTC